MRIEIHPETEAEKKAHPEPTILAGVRRFGLAGLRDPVLNAQGEQINHSEFGHIHGPWSQIVGDFARATQEVNQSLAGKAAFEATVAAHNHIAQQIEASEMGKKLVNGQGLRLQR